MKEYQALSILWTLNVAWILLDHHHTNLHCVVTPWGNKLRFSDTTSPVAGKNMSCLTKVTKRDQKGVCIYGILRPSNISVACQPRARSLYLAFEDSSTQSDAHMIEIY